MQQFRALVLAAGHQTDAEKNGEVYVFIENQWDCKEGACWRQPGFQQSDDEPVVCVSWHDRKMFCRWLSQEAGRLIRLPSEAEWDDACRAGSLDYDPAIRDEMAWHGLNSGIGPAAAGQEPNPWGLLDNVGNRMHPVARQKPNVWGLYDMLDNVSEWCQDLWHNNYEGAPTSPRQGLAQEGSFPCLPP